MGWLSTWWPVIVSPLVGGIAGVIGGVLINRRERDR